MWFAAATNFEIPAQAQNQNVQRTSTSDLARENEPERREVLGGRGNFAFRLGRVSARSSSSGGGIDQGQQRE